MKHDPDSAAVGGQGGSAPLEVYLVLLETGGNQAYIFDTNKRREVVGASYLIKRLADWVYEALGGPNPDRGAVDGWRIDQHDAEVITAAAGGAMVLVRTAEAGRALVRHVTRVALRDAPGLDVAGVVSEGPFRWEGSSLHEESTQLRKALPQARSRRPGPAERFLRLPIVAECLSSGLPASGFGHDGTLRPVRSWPCLAKLAGYDSAIEVLADDAGIEERTVNGKKVEPSEIVNEIVERLADVVEWSAVVHADGNGLGRVFQDFGSHIEDRGRPDWNRRYVDTLRDFSRGLDGCTKTAFRTAYEKAARGREAADVVRGYPPILPLVLGGDDLTVVCDGAVALPFVRDYLDTFEQEATANKRIREVMRKADGEVDEPVAVTAAAGVAIVKRHYPFSLAYELSEQLCAEAKAVKNEARGCSALSFHVLTDASGGELADLRHRLTRKETRTIRLVAQPYVTTAGAGTDVSTWAGRHHISNLRRRVAALRRRDDEGERVLPNSQLHDLRAGLFISSATAETRFARLRARYGRAVGDLGVAAGTENLFWIDGTDGDERELLVSGLLDAMDAAEFLGDEPPASGTTNATGLVPS